MKTPDTNLKIRKKASSDGRITTLTRQPN